MHHVFRKHVIATILLSIALIAGAGGLVLVFRFIHTKALAITKIKEDIATYEVNEKALGDEVKELQALESRITTLSSYVITPTTIPTLLSELEKKATEYPVVFEITDVATPVQEGVQKLYVDFTLSGSYEGVTAFLATLQQQPYALVFTELDFIRETVASPAPETRRGQQRAPQVVYRVFGVIHVVSF